MFVLLGKVKTDGAAVIFQGKVAATAILASSKKPEIFGKCFAAAGIVESFAIFALVAGLIMAGGL